MLFEEYKRKINIAVSLKELDKILNDIKLDSNINDEKYLELERILNNKKIEIQSKQIKNEKKQDREIEM